MAPGTVFREKAVQGCENDLQDLPEYLALNFLEYTGANQSKSYIPKQLQSMNHLHPNYGSETLE